MPKSSYRYMCQCSLQAPRAHEGGHAWWLGEIDLSPALSSKIKYNARSNAQGAVWKRWHPSGSVHHSEDWPSRPQEYTTERHANVRSWLLRLDQDLAGRARHQCRQCSGQKSQPAARTSRKQRRQCYHSRISTLDSRRELEFFDPNSDSNSVNTFHIHFRIIALCPDDW